jgi:hypothetical protein
MVLKDHCDIPVIFHMGVIRKARTKFCWRSTGVNLVDTKEQGTVVYINWPKKILGVKCAFLKA